jgi:hypothetical protein
MVALIALFAFQTSNEVVLEPTDDVWVYPHAGDPSSDPFLRVWGAGGAAVAKDAGEVENFSYSYLRFDTSSLPKKKLLSAELVLKSAGKEASPEEAKSYPLEVRPIEGDFSENTWTYDFVVRAKPSSKVIFSEGLAIKKDDWIGFRFNLLSEKSMFADFVKSKTIGLALTTKYDVAELGMKGVYKVYSKDNKDVSDRPKLVLKFEN